MNSWHHHESQNKRLDLMTTTVSLEIMVEIKSAEYFSISLDEDDLLPIVIILRLTIKIDVGRK